MSKIRLDDMATCPSCGDKDKDFTGHNIHFEPVEECFGSEDRHNHSIPHHWYLLGEKDSGYSDSNLFGRLSLPPTQPSSRSAVHALDQFIWPHNHDHFVSVPTSIPPEQESLSLDLDPLSTQYVNHPGIHSHETNDATSVTLVSELTSLFQRLEKELERVRSEKYDAVKDTFQRDIELLKSKVAELETHNRNDHEKKLHEEIDGFKSMLTKISEKIDDMSHKADESEKTIIEIFSQKVDELQLVAAKSESGRQSNTAKKSPEKTSCTMEEVDSSTLYEAEFKSGHLGIIKGN